MSNTKRNSSGPKTAQDREIEKMLVDGEEVILRAELHWAIYWKSFAVLIFALFMWALMPIVMPLAMLVGICGALMLCTAILTQHFLILAVTNKRVLARYGLLQMDVVDIRLSKIESIDLERMLLGHMLGYASVVVMGTGQRVLRVQFISNAEAFRRYYNAMVLAEEGNEEAEEQINKMKDDVGMMEPRESKPAGRRTKKM